MQQSFLSNERIYLRAIEPEDLSVVYDMENDPEMWEISSFTVPYSRFLLRRYIEESQSDVFADKQLRLMIVRKKDCKVIGTIDITDYVPLHGRGEVGVAVRADYRSEGYAKDALNLLCDYAFHFLHLHQLYAHVPVGNNASMALFSACGFSSSGVLKEWNCVNGNYVDVALFQRISSF